MKKTYQLLEINCVFWEERDIVCVSDLLFDGNFYDDGWNEK